MQVIQRLPFYSRAQASKRKAIREIVIKLFRYFNARNTLRHMRKVSLGNASFQTEENS